jgi:3-oxoacyl-[acyl-carrier protein] reductase
MSEKRVILVTGGSRGLGAAVTKKYSKEGWNVVVNYLTESAKVKLEKELRESCDLSNVLFFKADVSERDQVKTMFDKAVEHFGGVDVLLNCAGRNLDAPFLEITDEMWDSVINVHLRGTFLCCQEYALHNPDKPGTIINIGAVCGLHGRKNGANFCSAKAGIIALTKCLAIELAPRIHVNCLIPGSFQTEEVVNRYRLDTDKGLEKVLKNIPLGKLGNLSDFTSIVCTMIRSEFITGQTIIIDGGQVLIKE